MNLRLTHCGIDGENHRFTGHVQSFWLFKVRYTNNIMSRVI